MVHLNALIDAEKYEKCFTIDKTYQYRIRIYPQVQFDDSVSDDGISILLQFYFFSHVYMEAPPFSNGITYFHLSMFF